MKIIQWLSFLDMLIESLADTLTEHPELVNSARVGLGGSSSLPRGNKLIKFVLKWYNNCIILKQNDLQDDTSTFGTRIARSIRLESGNDVSLSGWNSQSSECTKQGKRNKNTWIWFQITVNRIVVQSSRLVEDERAIGRGASVGAHSDASHQTHEDDHQEIRAYRIILVTLRWNIRLICVKPMEIFYFWRPFRNDISA